MDLMRFVRAAVETAVRRTARPEPPAMDYLQTRQGAFVSLKKARKLRGCIGRIIASTPLAQTILEVAADSALHDHRFPPVAPDELAAIEIELSVLTEPVRISSIGEIRPGIDGIIIRGQGRSGCFLPQVATETGWSVDEFVRRCLTDKAGLPPDAFAKGLAAIEVFQAEIFREGS